ncbi:glycosyl hydrolase family 18 protein [Mahella australiensis]|uniref:Glycoside hydrolase family 18 n=1 Tax=Mahella australiensis (strain DSM 15567 / CIP 107919 / 50-1 BON) TaxID=697281 RepID=F4A0F7_MAHA5|nr:glycosyl hydrolase family 18 protein [Mahella australiensis]AEE98018.1 glycoside hydrolase family 18 [Mahella australiensis 50-1 BON]
MSWTGAKTARMYQEMMDYGDRFYMISLFDFHVEYVDGTHTTGRIVGNITSGEWEAINKWPHVKWYLCVRNDGYEAAFQDLLDNAGGAQDTFISEIQRLINEYPFVAGIDIDLERGGGSANIAKAVALFQRISSTVHAAGKLLHVDLPALTGPGQSLGGEYWCDYQQLGQIFDSCTIMSYGYAWAGSAPGPISPRGWLEDVYDYAVTVIPPAKIYMGLPGYGYRWQIDHPTTGYRGTSWLYTAAVEWMLGHYNHTNDGPPQPLIPWAALWDEDNMCPYMLLHVYDMQIAEDRISSQPPMQQSDYGNRTFMTAYRKVQVPSFVGSVSAKGALAYDEWDEALTISSDFISARTPAEGEEPGYAIYSFSVPTSGTYDIAVQVNYTWFDKATIGIEVDGALYQVSQPTQWYPLARVVHWVKLATISLSAGTHTLKFVGESSASGAQFYGFNVCQSFTFEMSAGQAQWTLTPQTYVDVNGQEVQAADGYRLTLEVLRRAPEYASIWNDDFRSYASEESGEWNTALFNNYYTATGGTWIVQGTAGLASHLKQTSVATAQCLLNYSSFEDMAVWATFSFTGQEAGIIFGSNKVGLQPGKVVLYCNGSLAASVDADTTGSNTLRVRVRGSECKVWLNSRLVITASVGGSNRFGLYTTNATIDCTLLAAGDAYWMYPQEAVTVTTPAGMQQLGRIERTDVEWDPVWGYIRVPAGTEESSSRDETISMDWDYLHSNIFTASSDLAVTIKADDIGIWVSRLYLCDADGASIAYYSDVNQYQYWMDRAEFEWGLQGIGVWALGQQDPAVYKYLPPMI